MQFALNVPPGSKNPHEAWLASFEHNHLGDEAAPAILQIYLARPILLTNITFTADVGADDDDTAALAAPPASPRMRWRVSAPVARRSTPGSAAPLPLPPAVLGLARQSSLAPHGGGGGDQTTWALVGTVAATEMVDGVYMATIALPGVQGSNHVWTGGPLVAGDERGRRGSVFGQGCAAFKGSGVLSFAVGQPQEGDGEAKHKGDKEHDWAAAAAAAKSTFHPSVRPSGFDGSAMQVAIHTDTPSSMLVVVASHGHDLVDLYRDILPMSEYTPGYSCRMKERW